MKKPKGTKKSRRRKVKDSAEKASKAGSSDSGVTKTKSGQTAQPTPKTSSPKAAAVKSGGPMQWWEKGGQFFREVKVELKKVTWPSRKETSTTTTVVVVLVLISAAFLGLIDLGLGRLIRSLVG